MEQTEVDISAGEDLNANNNVSEIPTDTKNANDFDSEAVDFNSGFDESTDSDDSDVETDEPNEESMDMDDTSDDEQPKTESPYDSPNASSDESTDTPTDSENSDDLEKPNTDTSSDNVDEFNVPSGTDSAEYIEQPEMDESSMDIPDAEASASDEVPESPGGLAAAGAGMGMGMAAGSAFGNMAQNMFAPVQPSAPVPAVSAPSGRFATKATESASAPAASGANDPVAKLKKLKEMLDLRGVLSRVTDNEAARKVERAYDAINSSPAKSHSNLAQMELRISTLIDELDDAVSNGDKPSTISTADTLLAAINERNNRLNSYHAI